MKRVKSSLFLFFKLPLETRRDIIWILFLSFKAFVLVNMVPVRYYFKKYHFGTAIESKHMQPYRKELRTIKRVIRVLPFSITCLMESLIIQSYFKKFNFIVPIALGIRNEDGLKAHAWILSNGMNGYKSIFK